MWGSSHQFECPEQRLSTPASGFSPGAGDPPPLVLAVQPGASLQSADEFPAPGMSTPVMTGGHDAQG